MTHNTWLLSNLCVCVCMCLCVCVCVCVCVLLPRGNATQLQCAAVVESPWRLITDIYTFI